MSEQLLITVNESVVFVHDPAGVPIIQLPQASPEGAKALADFLRANPAQLATLGLWTQNVVTAALHPEMAKTPEIEIPAWSLLPDEEMQQTMTDFANFLQLNSVQQSAFQTHLGLRYAEQWYERLKLPRASMTELVQSIDGAIKGHVYPYLTRLVRAAGSATMISAAEMQRLQSIIEKKQSLSLTPDTRNPFQSLYTDIYITGLLAEQLICSSASIQETVVYTAANKADTFIGRNRLDQSRLKAIDQRYRDCGAAMFIRRCATENHVISPKITVGNTYNFIFNHFSCNLSDTQTPLYEPPILNLL